MMEPGRVELPSVIAHNAPLIHRFIHSNPRGGNYLLSQVAGCSSDFLKERLTRENRPQHPLGLSNTLNGVAY
jgi:hypothetical protein